MHRNTIAYVIVAVLFGFIGGFWLANSINRSAVSSPSPPRNSTNSAGTNSAAATSEPDLSDAELSSKIAEADKNPANFAFQRDLGISLYRYAAMKQDDKLLREAVRILERANSLNAKDFDVLVALGNAHFDIGFAKKDAASFQTAREVYAKALEIKPDDADVMTDRGLTYFLQNPPAYDKAATELQKVADANPKHERSLQFLVQTYVKQNKTAEAEKAFAKLKSINPNNSAIQELNTLIASQTGTVK